MLKRRFMNGWGLFWLITVPISALMVIAIVRTGLSSGPAVSSLIQLSVRCAVPLLYVTFAASSVQVLFPGAFGRWLLRNRKFVGLSFAAGMAWQGLFIVWMVTGYTDYYVNEVYVLRDAIEGVTGYVLLAAMTVTSFRFARSRMAAAQWKWLHKVGIYYLWMYAFSVYWWNLFYYGNAVWIDYLYYWAGFLAWALRAAAWSVSRQRTAGTAGHPALGVVGVAAVATGLVIAAAGSAWYPVSEQWLTGYGWTRIPETYLPYWPFEPWFAVAAVLAGAFLLKRARA